MALAQTENTIILYGKIDTIPAAQYYISYQKNGVSVRDTLIVDDEGRFQYKAVYTEPLYVLINLDNTEEFPWYDPDIVGYHAVYEFWVDPGQETYFEGAKDGSISVNSLTHNESLIYRERVDSIYRSMREQSRIDISRALDNMKKEFIAERPLSYYSLYLFYHMLREKEPDLQFIEHQLKRFPADILQTYMADNILERISVIKTLALGQPFPDFQQKDTEEKVVRFSDFEGKYILIDFWASWCVPCRKEHPHLVQAYKKYKENGFEIISISLDDNRDDWLKAIEDDGLTWTQLSDLQGSDNSVAKQFFIRSIPENFLLDANGVIIARGIRGKQLLDTLNNLFEEQTSDDK